jgi:azurin
MRTLLALLLAGMLATAGYHTPGPPEDPAVVVLEPKGNEMLYATTEITAKAGTPLKVVFNNTATSPAMVHNFTLLKPNAPIDEVGLEAIHAGEAKGYIPEHDAILFYTPMAAPGERVEVAFTVPPPGDYPYVCLYPGHYALMRGVLHVTP